MVRKLAVASGLIVGILALTVAPAWAHVSVNPSTATRGGFVTLTFQVPNEMDDASTTKVQVKFPEDHPIADASVKPVAGWNIDVSKSKLTTPVTTDDGETLTEAVNTVTWTATAGNGIEPGQFEQFLVSVGLPSDGDSLVFPALQTYSNGDVVRWVDPVTPGGPEAEHPAPTVELTAGSESDAHGTTPTTTVSASTTGEAADAATTSDVDSARTIGIIGIVIGALGLIVAGFALASRRRSA